MYYTIYKITNLVNSKIYIGMHQTNDLDDGYMGSGTYLNRAKEKYGLENFTKEYLHFLDSYEEMRDKEKELVDKDFLLREDVYNLTLGGEGGGWYYMNTADGIAYRTNTENFKNWYIAGTKAYLLKYNSDPVYKQNVIDRMRVIAKKGIIAIKEKYPNGTFYGRTHDIKSKEAIGKANSIHQKGEGNSRYGTIWIHNIDLKQSKNIEKNCPIPKGWLKGRILNWDSYYKFRKCITCGNVGCLSKSSQYCSKVCKPCTIVDRKYKNGYTVLVDNIEYKSISEAADTLGIGHETARMRFKSENFKNYIIKI